MKHRAAINVQPTAKIERKHAERHTLLKVIARHVVMHATGLADFLHGAR